MEGTCGMTQNKMSTREDRFGTKARRKDVRIWKRLEMSCLLTYIKQTMLEEEKEEGLTI
jgi:hypothetical protein